ncbi:helix-turn-helix domain-containing protein [Nostoc sp. XA010]|uniref:helix-turn-helix domain-containing protein n=1 Tax=Nostoc sp. XA010 TaxID=2780407 RepID=UPI001E526F79|nr:helix-turn-helix transcriptional regulator [Nostoc sp. XA010]MCC5661991.1 helix-turn-helix domain-containing protein [Nostoc sp. XA010]
MTAKVNIKELRLGKNLTQRQVADLLGVTESNYRKLESNKVKSVSLIAIYKLCKAFSCTPNDLFELVENEAS